MTKNREAPKRPADRRPAWAGPNLVWSLIAAAVAGLFAMSLINSTPDVELSYSDLEKLIRASSRASGEPETNNPSDSARWIEIVQRGSDPKSAGRYGDLQDVVIGAFQVSGTVPIPGTLICRAPQITDCFVAGRSPLPPQSTRRVVGPTGAGEVIHPLPQHSL